MIIRGSFVFICVYLTYNSHVIAHVILINDHSWVIHVIAHVIFINDHSWVILRSLLSFIGAQASKLGAWSFVSLFSII